MTTTEPLRVLVVCTGNICRSPMGEIVLRKMLRDAGLGADRVVVTSAGVSDEEEGNPIDYRARRVLEDAGYPIHHHIPHKVRRGELAQQDLVLAMTVYHESSLRSTAEREGTPLRTAADGGPAIVPGQTTLRMWREFDPEAPTAPRRRHELDAPDPWYGGMEDFWETLDTVERGARVLVQEIAAAFD